MKHLLFDVLKIKVRFFAILIAIFQLFLDQWWEETFMKQTVVLLPLHQGSQMVS